MSLIELVIAAAILFIIMTGVLGLVGQTTLMSAQAVEATVVDNVVSSYTEYVQSLPFDQIALVDDGGVLASEVTTEVAGTTVTIVPTVTVGTGTAEHTKTLGLTVSAVGRNGRTSTYTTSVTIRDRSRYLTQSVRDAATDPEVSFTAPTPPEDTVVWSTYWMEGETQRPLALGLSAEASEGRHLTNVALWIDDSWVARDQTGEYASWTPGARTWSTSAFVWNTLQTEPVLQPDGVTYLDTTMIPDGSRTLTLYATDSDNVTVFTVRRLIVDNVAPSRPGVPAPTSAGTAWKVDLGWQEAIDGTQPADRYRVSVRRQKTAAEMAVDPSTQWAYVWLEDRYTAEPAFSLATQPFTRYIFGVRAVSPRGLTSERVWVETAFTSRPLVTGTYTVTGRKVTGKWYYDTQVNLSVTPPAMQTAGVTAYRWHGVSSTGTTYTAVTTTPSYTTTIANVPNTPAQIQWWVEVQYTPAGTEYGNGVSQLITSNRVGPTGTQVGTYTFTEGVW
jgi:Tfp pilus assembly protein PilV